MENSVNYPPEAVLQRRSHRVTLAFIVVAAAVSALAAAESPQQAFARSWEGRTVVLKQPLYTLVYDERSRIGRVQTGKRDGLTVVTPFEGTYLQFDGRRGRDDIKDTQPQSLRDSVAIAYVGDSLLEIEASKTIEPIVITRHEAGVECVVRKIEMGRYTVRLVFASTSGIDADRGPLTSLTVQWPIPLSKSLTERALIEKLIRQFVEIKPTS